MGDDDDTGPNSAAKDSNGLVLPFARVKKLMKDSDTDISSVSVEAVFAVTKATELFLQEVAERAYEASSTAQEKRQLDYKDVAKLVESWEPLDILGATVPPRLSSADVYREQQKRAADAASKCPPPKRAAATGNS